jgi:DNA-binding transcriptional ArsR family regulator
LTSVSSSWQALADPNRRAVLELLLERPRPVGELVEQLGLSQPGTSKHLKVLREAGLVHVRQDANRRVYALDPGPLNELDVWLAPYRRLCNDSTSRLRHDAGGLAAGARPWARSTRRSWKSRTSRASPTA